MLKLLSWPTVLVGMALVVVAVVMRGTVFQPLVVPCAGLGLAAVLASAAVIAYRLLVLDDNAETVLRDDDERAA